MARIDEVRLLTKVARLYYELNLRQTEIAEQLNLSQPTVSRLLRRARQEEIVKITVTVPSETQLDLETALEARYGLKQAIVVDCSQNEEAQILRDIARAAAFYIETTIRPDDVIGVSGSGSSTMLAVMDAMPSSIIQTGNQVVQILGDIGNPAHGAAGTHLVRRLASLLEGSAILLPAPALPPSLDARRILMEAPFVRDAFRMFNHVTVALVAIGPVERSKMLATFRSAISSAEVDLLQRLGAVGDICLRFFDISGSPVLTPLDERVIGVTLEQLRQVRRIVGVVGGRRKLAAIQGVLEGHWLDVLITDRFTAERIVYSEDSSDK